MLDEHWVVRKIMQKNLCIRLEGGAVPCKAPASVHCCCKSIDRLKVCLIYWTKLGWADARSRCAPLTAAGVDGAALLKVHETVGG